MQGLLGVGAQCWVLHPSCGTRPVAEGIAGSEPTTHVPDSRADRSFLMTLCEGGLQSVKVTKVYKKHVLLMFTEDNPTLQYLDQAVTPPAPNDTTVKWSVRYLVEKEEDACAAAIVPITQC